MTLRADIVVEGGALAALASDWWELWERCPGATPFASPAWLLPWWDTFSPGPLLAVTVRRSGQLVGLGAFWREDGPLGLRLLPLGIGITDYLDVLADPNDPDVLPAMAAAVLAHPGWEVWSLEDLLPDARAYGLTSCVPETSVLAAAQSACPVMPLDGRGLPAGKRRKLAMACNRMARRDGTIRAVPPDGIGPFLDDLVRLHAMRWQARGEGGILGDPAVRRFHALALPRLAERGLARLFTATMEGRVIGAYYGLQRGTRSYAYLGGFDPGAAFESPGTVLMGHAIASAEQNGATEYHLLRGREAYKYEWGAEDLWTSRLTLRRPGP